jgi:hypothetical protein
MKISCGFKKEILRRLTDQLRWNSGGKLKSGHKRSGRQHQPLLPHPEAVFFQGQQLSPREKKPESFRQALVGECITRIPYDHRICMRIMDGDTIFLEIPVDVSSR